MRDVLQYFDLILKISEQSSAVTVEIDIEQLDYRRGIVEGTIYFKDGSRLEFLERIVIERARPVKRYYRYQYVLRKSAVFRYDNAPHYPKLPTFPHHKHIGRKTIATEEPSLKQVLQEIEDLLPMSKEAIAQPPRSRPQSKKR
ncbi:MAG: DUF6516 family protein [Acidobacteria bacterium]|nr:DUF6516 family protein [Acidobacteriota bacterium]